MRPRNIVLLAALLLGAAGAAHAQRDTVLVEWGHVDYYADGVRLATEERYEEAIEQFKKALELAPDHDPSLFETAGALASLDRAAEAEPYSARAVALDPENRWYRERRGRILISLERFDEATAEFEAVVTGGGEFDPENYRLLAVLYFRQERMEEAMATLVAAERRLGPSPQLVEMKRGLLVETGRLAEAAAVTEAYIATAPYDEEQRLSLSWIYARQGRDSLRMATLNEIVEINPHNPQALWELADAYRTRGQDRLSLAAVKQLFTLPAVPFSRKKEMLDAVAGNINFYRANYPAIGELALMLVLQYPGEASTVEFYADHATRGGDAESALSILKGRLARPGAPLSTYMKTIQIEAWRERVDSVGLWSDRALAAYPGEMEIYLLRAGLEQYLKHYEAAHRTLRAALREARTDSLRGEVWGAVGTLWHERGKDKKCFAAYEKALRYNKDNALVLNNYAYFLSERGRELDRALGMAQRAVKLRPGTSSYLDTYAWTLFKTGDAAEAKRVMQQALPLDRDGSAELLMHYGDILWALGEEYMASVYWKRARDAGWEPVAEIEERLGRVKR